MQHLIAVYGYVAIFLLMVAESACIPVPSELIMTFGGAIAAGAVPGSGLNLVAVIAAGVAGNVAGSYVAWAIGRYGGQRALQRWGKRFWLRDQDIGRANRWFDRHGQRAVLIGRVLPVVRTFISLPAGIAGMRPIRFGVYTVLGCIPWTAALAIAGYAVGARWQSVVNGFRIPTYVIGAAIAVAAVIAIWRHARRRRAERSSQGSPRPDATGPDATSPDTTSPDTTRPDATKPAAGPDTTGEQPAIRESAR